MHNTYELRTLERRRNTVAIQGRRYAIESLGARSIRSKFGLSVLTAASFSKLLVHEQMKNGLLKYFFLQKV